MMNTITKKELIDRLCEQVRAPRSVVRAAVQGFLDEIVKELARGNRLEFRDFGVFETKQRAARRAQNPKTLEPVSVPARRSVKFKPGHLLRDTIEGKTTPGAPAGSGSAGGGAGQGNAAQPAARDDA